MYILYMDIYLVYNMYYKQLPKYVYVCTYNINYYNHLLLYTCMYVYIYILNIYPYLYNIHILMCSYNYNNIHIIIMY